MAVQFDRMRDEAKVTLFRVPRLYIAAEVLAQMSAVVELSDKEVGWFCEIEELDGGDYRATALHVPGQDVAASTTEIQPADLAALVPEIGPEAAGRLRLWGHSHVNMGTSPSAQDGVPVEQARDNGAPYFYRMIVNKKGEVRLTYYDFSCGYSVDFAPWELDVALLCDSAAIKARLADKVREKTPAWRSGAWPYGGSYYTGTTGTTSNSNYVGYAYKDGVWTKRTEAPLQAAAEAYSEVCEVDEQTAAATVRGRWKKGGWVK